MASECHKHSLHRSWTQRVLRVALPVGGVLALIVSSWAVAFDSPDPVNVDAHLSAPADSSDLESNVSRSMDVRPPLPEEGEADITGTKYVTAALDVHAGPDEKSPVLTEIKPGKKVSVTGKTDGKWAEIIHKGTSRWVTSKFLTSDKPLSAAPCASGSAVEAGLQPDTVGVYRAVCAQFPGVSQYGGRSGGGGEHATGRAIDIMVIGPAGDAIAAFAQAHALELGISQVIYRQRIWTTQRGGDGWRPMSDRGSVSANHMDHVHVTTYGNSGTS